jgi:leucyl aminopeptidase
VTKPATTLTLVDSDPAELAVDAVIIGVHSQRGGASGRTSRSGRAGAGGSAGSDRQDTLDASADLGPLLLASGAESITVAFDGKLTKTLALLGATGTPGEVIKLASLGTITAPLVVAVGLGPEPTGAAPAAETLRRAAAAGVRALAGSATVALALPVPDDEDGPAALRALAEGALLGGYRFAGYKTRQQPTRRDPVRTVSVHVPDAKDKVTRAEIKRAAVVGSAVAQCRDWVNIAPNDLRPPDFADQVTAAATQAGLQVEVLDEKALRKGGYGGILAVGQGSVAPPRLVRLGYVPTPRAKAQPKRVALVGKGITFDTGGLAIKPAQGMWEMKSDMAGAAAVASVMLAVAALKPPVAVTAYLPMAENMLSGTAYRPGDVVTMYNGKKVEVLNTDAEGRMILGDAMARACEDDPDYLFEVSTLTGGQVVALGKRIAGVMGSVELCERVRAAGDAVGEPSWPMPLPDEIRTSMDSDVADILQVSAGMERAGHMLQGGIFLREFVTDEVPWAHIDIAGPSYHAGEPTGYWAKGGTGVPVRTLLQLVEEIAQE